MKAIPQDRPEFYGKDIPLEIRNFYMSNEVDTFQFDRPYHQGVKDPNNESKVSSLLIYGLKYSLRWQHYS